MKMNEESGRVGVMLVVVALLFAGVAACHRTVSRVSVEGVSDNMSRSSSDEPVENMRGNLPPEVIAIAAGSGTNRATFHVDRVERARKPLAEIPFADFVGMLATNIQAYSMQTSTVVATCAEAYDDERRYANQFVLAVDMAYNEHRPISISPDHIWMLICQGVGLHIDNNADKLRSLLVSQRGKVVVKVDSATGVAGRKSWNEIIEEFTLESGRAVDGPFRELMTPKFTTSGPGDITAFRVSFLSSMSNYIEFWVAGACGFPEITIEGKPDDWRDIARRVEELRKYELGWWVDQLGPILAEFTAASEGRPNKAFWSSMYKQTNNYGRTVINGWITRFFPYVGDEEFRYTVTNRFGNEGLFLGQIPGGLSRAPFIYTFGDTGYPMEFMAGFIGVSQDRKTLTLRPQLNWLVRQTGNPGRIDIDKLRARAVVRAP